MMMKRVRLTLLLLFLTLTLTAQEQQPWQQLVEQLMGEEEAEETDWSELLEELERLASHPLDANTATREDWAMLPFLSEQQLQDIEEYLYRYGPMRSLNELRLISSLDYRTLELLPYFIYVRATRQEPAFPSPKTLRQHGRHELVATARLPLYERRGDRNGYLGYKYRHSLRYEFSYGNRLRAGLVGAQDGGEPFLSSKNTLGYDFYSLYIQARQLGRLEQLTVGKYRLTTGMGLLLNSSFLLGKTATLSSLGRRAQLVSPHASANPASYFQGASATLRLSRPLRLMVFASCRPLDATLNPSDSSAATIVRSGYHRTTTEMDKKNNLTECCGGG